MIKNLDDTDWQGRFGWEKTLLFSDDDFKSKGTKVQVLKLAPGVKIEPHYHRVRTEAFYILKGRGVIRLNEEQSECSPHDYFLCPADTIHGFENTGKEDFVIMALRTNDPGDSDMLWLSEHPR